MANFIGDHPCKVDAKGRILFPAALKKQAGTEGERFVIKKDLFEPCLVIYTMQEWERQSAIIRKQTNSFNKEHNRFIRAFFRGTAEISLDATGRLLVPRRLLDLVEADKDVILSGQISKIELWSKERYDASEESEEDFAALAEKIMSGAVNEEE